MDRYIVDFVHLEARLAVELDGGYHFTPEQQLLDKERDEALDAFGWTVKRYMNEEVTANAGGVALELQTLADQLVLARLPSAT